MSERVSAPNERYVSTDETRVYIHEETNGQVKGDPLVSPDFFKNAMAHPRMKIQVLLSPKLPLVKK